MTAPRKVYNRVADIPRDVLAQLNAGTLSTATLSESLALDFAALLQAAVPNIPADCVRLVESAARQAGTLLLAWVADGVVRGDGGLQQPAGRATGSGAGKGGE